MNSMIEQIARRLCEAAGYDPDMKGLAGRPRWLMFVPKAEHVVPLLAEAWDEGYGEQRECCGICPSGACPWDNNKNGPANPYRKEQGQ